MNSHEDIKQSKKKARVMKLIPRKHGKKKSEEAEEK
jgi:hypothetical protein